MVVSKFEALDILESLRIVARRNIVGLTSFDGELGLVIHPHFDLSGHQDAEMSLLAGIGLDDRLHMFGPLPALLHFHHRNRLSFAVVADLDAH